MNNKIILESMALDLKRVALGYHRGSEKMAERFLEEAIKRKNETDIALLKPYMRKLLDRVQRLNNDRSKIAEDAQMLSTLIQNYAIFNYS